MTWSRPRLTSARAFKVPAVKAALGIFEGTTAKKGHSPFWAMQASERVTRHGH